MDIIIIILKILLFTFLAIIALLLAAALVILFVPIKYDIIYRKNDDTSTRIKLRWLLSIVKLNYSNENNLPETRLTIFGLRIGGKNKEEKKKKNSKGVDADTSGEGAQETDTEKTADTEEIKKENDEKKQELKQKQEKPAIKERVKELKEKFKNIVRSTIEIKDKIKFILGYPDKKLIISYTIICLKELITALKPKIFYCEAEIGFDDPSKTGYALAAISIVKPLFFNGLDLKIRGNFEKEVMHFDVMAKGKLGLWFLVYPLAKYALKRPIWRIIQLLRGKDGYGEYEPEHQS